MCRWALRLWLLLVVVLLLWILLSDLLSCLLFRVECAGDAFVLVLVLVLCVLVAISGRVESLPAGHCVVRVCECGGYV